MDCARTRQRRPKGLAGTVPATARSRLGLCFLLIAGLTRALPSEAQPVSGTASGGASAPGVGPGGVGPVGVGGRRDRARHPAADAIRPVRPAQPADAAQRAAQRDHPATTAAASLFAGAADPRGRDQHASAVQSRYAGCADPALCHGRRAVHRQCPLCLLQPDRGRRNPADPRGQRIGRHAAPEGGVQRLGRGRRLYPDQRAGSDIRQSLCQRHRHHCSRPVVRRRQQRDHPGLAIGRARLCQSDPAAADPAELRFTPTRCPPICAS